MRRHGRAPLLRTLAGELLLLPTLLGSSAKLLRICLSNYSNCHAITATMPASSFNDLPIELVGVVTAKVITIGDLLRLREVNRVFSTYATPRAFSTYHAVNTQKSIEGHHNIMHHAELAKLVRKVVVHCEAEPGENRLVNRGMPYSFLMCSTCFKSCFISVVEEDADARGIRLAMSANMSRLSLFSSLEELELDFFSGMVWQNFKRSGEDGLTMSIANPSKYFMLQTTIFQAITDTGPGVLPRDLHTLTISNLIPFPAPEYQAPTFEILMSRISHFSLSVHALRLSARHGEEMYAWFWSEMVPERFLEPAQSKLQCLTLFSDQPVGQVPSIDLSWLRFPHLTTLTLIGFMFNEERLVEDFIVRHGRTLQHLTLDTCPIHIGGAEGTPPRTWSVILQRFSEKLTMILDFRTVRRTGWGLHEVDPRIDLHCSYERCLTGYGYEREKNNKLPLSVIQADRIALRNLLRAVNHRRQAKGFVELDLPSLAVTVAAS